MSEHGQDFEDRWLQEQFRQSMPALPDAGFTRKVLRPLRRRAWLRGFLPYAALIVGGGIAAWPAMELVGALGHELSVVGQFDWQHLLEANQTLVIGIVVAVLSPLLVAALED